VRDRRLRAADALRHIAEREPELVEQYGVAPRLLDGREILARHVLDEPEQERLAVVCLADDRRHRRRARLAGSSPAALARDQLVAALEPRPQDDGLDHALDPDRVGEPGRRRMVEALAGLARVRMDLV